MAALSMQTLSIVWAGAFLGALAAGGAGFAFALVASSIWLHGLEPLQTTALVVACGTLLHVPEVVLWLGSGHCRSRLTDQYVYRASWWLVA